jgi:hypothetical protein
VTPAIRAVAWGSRELFGVEPGQEAAAWQLNAALPTTIAGGRTGVQPGGRLDDGRRRRHHARPGRGQGRHGSEEGLDFPFNGGTARITGRHCCSSLGWPTVIAVRTGNAGASGSLLQAADLAVANFENPAPNAFKYHTRARSSRPIRA